MTVTKKNGIIVGMFTVLFFFLARSDKTDTFIGTFQQCQSILPTYDLHVCLKTKYRILITLSATL